MIVGAELSRSGTNVMWGLCGHSWIGLPWLHYALQPVLKLAMGSYARFWRRGAWGQRQDGHPKVRGERSPQVSSPGHSLRTINSTVTVGHSTVSLTRMRSASSQRLIMPHRFPLSRLTDYTLVFLLLISLVLHYLLLNTLGSTLQLCLLGYLFHNMHIYTSGHAFLLVLAQFSVVLWFQVGIVHVHIFPVLLRYNQHSSLYKCKAYSRMVWLTYAVGWGPSISYRYNKNVEA